MDKWNKARSAIADFYLQELATVAGIVLPTQVQGGESVWNQFTMRILNGQRNRIQKSLKEKGIGSMVYYPIPLHLQQVHAELGYTTGSLPVSEQLSHEVLSLPMFPELNTSAQQIVTDSVSQVLAATYCLQ